MVSTLSQQSHTRDRQFDIAPVNARLHDMSRKGPSFDLDQSANWRQGNGFIAPAFA